MSSSNEPDHMRDLMDIMNRKEDLHPDLEPYLVQDGPLGVPFLNAPLVKNIMHSPQENAWMNKSYLLKKEQVEKAASDGDWHRYVFWHERAYRLGALLDAVEKGAKVDPKIYWELVGSIWTDSENIREDRRSWQTIWTEPVPKRPFCMSSSERKALKALPDVIQVWRGVGHRTAARGMSWTINKTKAEWFARRYSSDDRTPHLVSGVVLKTDVLAYFTGRNESEVVAMPSRVKNQKIETI
jgi:hypothetical protein